MTASSIFLFVVGPHRSGTSAVCASLKACGVTSGDNVLAAQKGVNDEGFWEDQDVVDINEALLASLGFTWYNVRAADNEADWRHEQFSGLAERARTVLSRGFGNGAVQLVKDPRFCFTLPFWLLQCEAIKARYKVLSVVRPAIDVARSLQKRDQFPLGVALRIWSEYRQLMELNVPPASPSVEYSELLENPPALMRKLGEKLEQVWVLDGNTDLEKAVRPSLRHHASESSIWQGTDQSLSELIDNEYSLENTLKELLLEFVSRGQALTSIGTLHTKALGIIAERDNALSSLGVEHANSLNIINERDAQICQLAKEHSNALSTITERDQQLTALHEQLKDLGQQHGYAISVVEERDGQLEERDGQLEERNGQLDEIHKRLAKLESQFISFPFIRNLWEKNFSNEKD